MPVVHDDKHWLINHTKALCYLADAWDIILFITYVFFNHLNTEDDHCKVIEMFVYIKIIRTSILPGGVGQAFHEIGSQSFARIDAQ